MKTESLNTNQKLDFNIIAKSNYVRNKSLNWLEVLEHAPTNSSKN